MSQNTIDRYEVLEQIGSGGMARVYKAEDTVLQRLVALKLLNERADPELKRRFQAEARAVAGLNHPNIVGVYDVGERDGWPYMVMEYVEGTNLKHMIQQRGTLPYDQVKDIVSQIGAALEYAHGKNLIHCDVKPHNIIIRSDGRAKLLDFGIAQAQVNRGRKQSEQVLGTPLYMAPEQLYGDKVTPATDVYGLGLVLWEALTGLTPERPSSGSPIYLDFSKTHLPGNLKKVIEKATSEEPSRRYSNVGQMVRAMRVGRGDEQSTVAQKRAEKSGRPKVVPASAKTLSEPRTRPASRPIRRRRTGLLLLPLMALIILVLVLAGSYFVPRILGAVSSAGDRNNPIPAITGPSSTAPATQETVAGPGTLPTAKPSPSAITPTTDVNAKWVVQMSARKKAVHLVIQDDGKQINKDLKPGDEMEVSADKYLRIWGKPASDLYINVRSPGSKIDNTRGTLIEIANRWSDEPVTSKGAFIYLGHPISDDRGDQ